MLNDHLKEQCRIVHDSIENTLDLLKAANDAMLFQQGLVFVAAVLAISI